MGSREFKVSYSNNGQNAKKAILTINSKGLYLESKDKTISLPFIKISEMFKTASKDFMITLKDGNTYLIESSEIEEIHKISISNRAVKQNKSSNSSSAAVYIYITIGFVLLFLLMYWMIENKRNNEQNKIDSNGHEYYYTEYYYPYKKGYSDQCYKDSDMSCVYHNAGNCTKKYCIVNGSKILVGSYRYDE